MDSLWNDSIFRQTAAIVLGTIFILGAVLFFLRKKNTHMAAGWASVKSWLFLAPLVLALIALPRIWTLVGLTVIAMSGVKSFFRITGIFHRTYFVIFCYMAIIALPVLIYYRYDSFYNFMPMLLLAAVCLIPLLCNSYKNMIQYIALTLMAFSFLGWSFMHLGKLIYLDMEKGPYLLIYLLILTEACDNMNIAFSRIFNKKFKPFSNISLRRSLEGFLLSTALTFCLAWAMRHLMPLRSEAFWLTAGFCASIAGGFGDITMSVIRRDLGIKDVGVFIIGRGDMMSRMDRLIFVAPIFYYAMYFLMQYPDLFA